MARPALEARIDLLGVVTLRAWRGGGWEVGDRHLRIRDGALGEELRSATYHADVADALEAALRRADGYAARVPGPETAATLLARTAGLVAAFAASLVDDPAASLRRERHGAGISQKTLARRSGVAESTIYMIEAGRQSPRADTLSRLLATCRNERGDRRR